MSEFARSQAKPLWFRTEQNPAKFLPDVADRRLVRVVIAGFCVAVRGWFREPDDGSHTIEPLSEENSDDHQETHEEGRKL